MPMYDKSKKTWSQRLKITKSDTTNTTTDTTVTTTSSSSSSSPTSTSAAAAAAAAAHTAASISTNAYSGNANSAHFLHSPTATIMQMPPTTLQLQQLGEYHGMRSSNSNNNKNNNNNNAIAGVIGYELLPSALSRSMKYAGPWIYGTVRGIPARPYHHYQQIHAAAYGHPHAAAIFAAHPLANATGAETLAVVICSCPEYLNGTKRDMKKASVCKKCKGSRLPLATIGGTMRLPAASAGMLQAPKLRSNGVATMRVVSSTKKSRPSILDPQKDPYDLMRRTRLSLEPCNTLTLNSKEQHRRSHGKSASPVRGRTRERGNGTPAKTSGNSSSSDANVVDCWLEEDSETLVRNSQLSNGIVTQHQTTSRRSILRCNVNPYDLISINTSADAAAAANANAKATASVANTGTATAYKKSPSISSNYSQYEFQPPKDDDFNVEDAALYDDLPPFATSSSNANKTNKNNKNNNNKNSNNKKQTPKAATMHNHSKESSPRLSIAEPNGKPTSANGKSHSYNNVQAIAGQRISLGEHRSKKKQMPKQSADDNEYECILIDTSQQAIAAAATPNKTQPQQQQQQQQQKQSHQQPKRPPRVKKADSIEETATPTATSATTTKTSELTKSSIKTLSQSDDFDDADDVPSITILSVTPPPVHIKSILKRPNSLEKDNEAQSTITAALTTATATNAKSPILATKSNAKAATTPKSQRHSSNATNSAVTYVAATTNHNTQTIGTSQFYIPLPPTAQAVLSTKSPSASAPASASTSTSTPLPPQQQTRKKVQFMVEDKIIHDDADINVSNDSNEHETDRQIQQQQQQHEHYEEQLETEHDKEQFEKAIQQQQQNVMSAEQKERMTTARQQQQEVVRSASTTFNYEYYQHKCEKQLSAQQQQQQELVKMQEQPADNKEKEQEQAATATETAEAPASSLLKQNTGDLIMSSAISVTTTAAAMPASTPLIAETKTVAAAAAATPASTAQTAATTITNNTNMKNNQNSSNNTVDYEDIASATAADNENANATTTTTVAAADSTGNLEFVNLHYENVLTPINAIAIATATANTPTEAETRSNSNNDYNKQNDMNVEQHQAGSQHKQTLSTATMAPTAMLATNSNFADINTNNYHHDATNANQNQNQTHNDKDDNNIVVVAAVPNLLQQQNELQTESPNENAAPADGPDLNTINDALAKAKQKLPAASSNDNNTAQTMRNPIRRTHSERHILYTNGGTNFTHAAATSHNKAALGKARNCLRQSCNHNGCYDTQNANDNDKSNGTCKIYNTCNNSANSNNGTAKALLNFQDTMALRSKLNRKNSKEFFEENAGSKMPMKSLFATSFGVARPREPPPPPPPSPQTPVAAPALMSAVATIFSDETNALANGSGSGSGNGATTKAAALTDATHTKASILSLLPAASIATNESATAAAIAAPNDMQNEASNNTQYKHATSAPQHVYADEINKLVMQNDNEISLERTKPLISEQNEAATTNDATSKATSIAAGKHQRQQLQQQQKRTIVHISPMQNQAGNEVHRLKISHTDDIVHCHTPNSASSTHSFQFQLNANNYSHNFSHNSNNADIDMDYNQKKTSILITGDDCYSTMNLSTDAATPLYQSSVVVADCSIADYEGLRMTTTSNTVTINVSSPRSAAEELIYQHNKLNTLLSRRAQTDGDTAAVSTKRAIIPIKGSSDVNLQRSASTTSSASTSSMTSISSSGSNNSTPKRGRTLIRLDYEQERKQILSDLQAIHDVPTDALSHEEELLKILRNPVEAVKRNLVPHVCGRVDDNGDETITMRSKKMKELNVKPQDFKLSVPSSAHSCVESAPKPHDRQPFIAKLLEDPMLSQVADGLEAETIAELIENSLKRLQETRKTIDISGTKDNDNMDRLITMSLQKIQEERQVGNIPCVAADNATPIPTSSTTTTTTTLTTPTTMINSSNLLSVPTVLKDEDRHSNRGSISSANSFASASNYEMFDFEANESDCYQSCSSEVNSTGDDDASSAATRSKFYQMLVDATLAEIEMSAGLEGDSDEHHYESIRHNGDPIYEEITDVPPPLPLTAPPINDADFDKKSARSIFEGASKYDILSYLVDAKERGLVPWREDNFDYPVNLPSTPIIIEEEASDTLSELDKLGKVKKDMSSRASILSDSSEDNQSTMSSLSPPPQSFMCGSLSLLQRKYASSDIERNDSGVGSETSKSSRSKYQQPLLISKNNPLHLCEDCDGAVETQLSDTGELYAPLVCRKCGKKRVERKEIITEIVETEEKYGRDLQIILEEFYHPMLVAGLLTQEQLSAIFLNTEELLENNQTLAERMRDALDIALEQGDEDLLTVNVGRIFLDSTQMLHAFESYCVRQANASLLLANLEKEKELLRIFLKVSQMENAVLRRMNLNSFLMVPVQRVTKYPLLLARLYKVTPAHLEGRELLKQAQEKIELHLNHINQEAKDVPTKLWRRISSSSPNRRASCEIDMINIKLRKMAIDVLEWNHDEVRFAMEGKLLYTQPTDSNWKKARTIKLTPVNALLVTNGKPSANYKAEKVMSDKLNFPKHTGIREASLLVVKEKCGRYTLLREPLYLDRCVVCSEADWDDYFEVQEIATKDTFIFKAEDSVRTKQWYTQLQFHAQGMGAWRKRRNALANIMINGMLTRA